MFLKSPFAIVNSKQPSTSLWRWITINYKSCHCWPLIMNLFIEWCANVYMKEVKVWLNSLFKVFTTTEIVMHNETSRSLFQKFNVYTLKENYMIKCLHLTNLSWWKLIKAFPNIIMTIINPLMNYYNHTYTEMRTKTNLLNFLMYQFKTIHSKATYLIVKSKSSTIITRWFVLLLSMMEQQRKL